MRSLLLVLVGCASSSIDYVTPPASTSQEVALGAIDGGVTRAPREPNGAPRARLTPTDGSELVPRSMERDVETAGPVTHTALRFTFHNPEPRQREGRFTFTLPPHAAVTRFAMKIGDELREARIVARPKGREVYERFLHRRVDPALLEQDAGNTFSARIFPIEASADKEILLEYDDLAASPGTEAVAAGGAFVARIDGELGGAAAAVDRVLYLVDTSASRADVLDRQIAVLEALIEAQGTDSHATVIAFDQTMEERAGTAQTSHWLALRGALGSSDLGAALARAAVAGLPRVVIIGDGTPTAGEHDPAKLARIIASSQIERVDAVQVGDRIDLPVLQALVRAGKQPGAILDGSDPARAARQLALAVGPPVPVVVEGATRTWPATTKDLAPGEPVVIYGLYDGVRPLVATIGDRRIPLAPQRGRAAGRLRRVVARAELAAMIDAQASADAIAQHALAHGLLSPYTSLIVLESEAHERRFLDAEAAPRTPGSRSFEAVLGTAAGAQVDRAPVALAATSTISVTTTYFLGNVTTTRTGTRAWRNPFLMLGTKNVYADVISPLALDVAAAQICNNPSRFVEDPYGGAKPVQVFAPPYEGAYQQVMTALAERDPRALAAAAAWHAERPTEVVAILALGEALEANGMGLLAARAYGSISDLYPNRAELLRTAGARLDRVGARGLAVDFYRRALRERPDQASTYRLLAWSLFRMNRPEEALEALGQGIAHTTVTSVQRILRDDAGIVAANIVARHPERRYAMPYPLAAAPSLRFALTWETDATNVDLLVEGEGQLLDNMRDGFGPEVFEAVPGGTYQLAAHYETKGAMGPAFGSLQIIRHDGSGGVIVEDRPFVIQNANGKVPLGAVHR